MSMLSLRRCSWVFALCVSLLVAPLALASGGISREAMADAMAQMMEAMGLFAPQRGGWSGQAGVPGWPSAFDGLGVPGTGGMEQFARSLGEAAGAVSLDGEWEGSDGSLLIVQAGFYRLYSAHGGYIDGELRIAERWLELTNPRAQFDHRFEFALDRGRLALRDANGQVFLYRRLVLGPGR
ncbi:hypothetical protein [Marichromatium bheemlicum]|uniref:DUF1579 domain-containing protein n=1 Tax=Marichromatium bheemlicum TaxID=365339 RepID=A0ABX1I9B2_9GAMM|nr:hypothetical protein [Marichromatium bheemlicum]NKN33781.1 hypothetical protein [Marichromatium bheemlicum]